MLLAFFVLALVAPAFGFFPEPVLFLPSGSPWRMMARAPASEVISLPVSLTPRDRAGVFAALDAVSDPFGPSYGAYLSHDEVSSMLAPLPTHLAAVQKWLKEGGATIVEQTTSGAWITVEITVAKAEQLLGVKFHKYVHTIAGRTITRASTTMIINKKIKDIKYFNK
jgi:hypothetical protein